MNDQTARSQHGLLWLGISLSIGLIVSTFLAMSVVERVKLANRTITVKGFAERRIVSDWVIWRGSLSTQSPNLIEAYKKLQNDLSKVMSYFKNKGVSDKAITAFPISTVTLYARDEKGMETSRVMAYRLSQAVKIQSADVDLITRISREATELIEDGVEFYSYSPEYYYTKVEDLKIEMLGEASEDAKRRAEQIAVKSGSQVGKLRWASQGVFQITPAYSTQVAGYGIYDTSTIEKSIKAITTIQYSIR